MALIKTDKEIEAIALGGQILSQILDAVVALVKVGANTADLEKEARRLVVEAGGRAAFLDYPMGDDLLFPSMLCLSVNYEIVHGPALPNRILENGDIVGIDLGMEWPIDQEKRAELGLPTNPYSERGGYYTDMARTVPVGEISLEAKKLIEVTKKCLAEAIKQVKPGNTINDIGRAVERVAKKNNFSVVRELVGHGVGHEVHEEPSVFNYRINQSSPDNIELETGMVIAIEPMINTGHWKVKLDANGFTYKTADKSLSAHFEHTVVVTKKGARILTI